MWQLLQHYGIMQTNGTCSPGADLYNVFTCPSHTTKVPESSMPAHCEATGNAVCPQVKPNVALHKQVASCHHAICHQVASRTHCLQSCLGVQCQLCSVLPSSASVVSSPLSLLFSNLKDSIMALQGYQCFCQPCTPTPKIKGTSKATVVAKLGAAAFAIIVTILCLLFAAVAVLVYRLKQASKMLLVSPVVVHVPLR